MMEMRFEWDERKNRANQRKHGIDFQTACLVFDDPFALSSQDRVEDGERRWQTIGLVGGVAVVLVAHTVDFESDCEVIRVISARRANSKERQRYESQAIH
jgi:hypothetical protein